MADNEAGSKTAQIKIVILDKPCVVEDLQVADVTDSSVTLTWKPPIHDGGAAIRFVLKANL